MELNDLKLWTAYHREVLIVQDEACGIWWVWEIPFI